MEDQKAELETSNRRVRLLEEGVAAGHAQFDSVVEGPRENILLLTEQLERE